MIGLTGKVPGSSVKSEPVFLATNRKYGSKSHETRHAMDLRARPFMNTLNFARLRDRNVSRCEEVFHKLDDWSPTDWATAMAGECGEACNLIKKLRRLDGADKNLDSDQQRGEFILDTAKELADLVIYADLLAARLGIDLGEAVVQKFNEVSAKRNSTNLL
jgi:NTP pyrophosphatase (non-canonical NTP hydrolase)